MANTTIYDVAGAARVSLATVSRVMNNPEKVNPDTRERVLKVIKELGYRPNAIARGLASRKTTTVGIVMADVSRASTSQLLGGIIDIAKKYDYAMKIFSMAEDEDIKEVMRTVVAEQVDGILFLNDELDSEQMELAMSLINEAQIPVVLCNVIYHGKHIPSVAIDYEKATYEITKGLIESGKRDIYLASTVRRYSINGLKEKGYEEAMQDAGLEPHLFRTSGLVDINSKDFRDLIQAHKVDSLISVRDSIAISFMNEAINAGFKVPDEISVIGLQNTKYSILARPNLTAMDTPVYDIGAVSMRLLTKFMKQEEVNEPQIVLPYTIVRRNSTK